MNRNYVIGGTVGVAGTLLAAGLVACDRTNERPNVIMIYVDDMGYSDPCCFGGNFTPTPNIDRLAEEGIRLNQYYSSAPISSPSRVGVTTGMYPLRWGISTYLQSRKGNGKNEQNDYLEPTAPTLARSMKAAGYATGHFGKWHMGGGRDVDNAPAITEYGFDEYTSTWESPDADPLLTASDWIWCDADSIKRWERTAYFVDKTLDFLKRHKGTPCYVNLWPDDMHTPWVPNSEVAKMSEEEWKQQDPFTEVLATLDVQIGRLLDGLDELGIADNTIVIFTSDNGPSPSFQNARTLGMKGQKAMLYEGGIRMPFIVRWPAKIKPNQVDDTTVACAVDLFPTICAITGVEPLTDYPLDGCDISKAIVDGEKIQREKPLFWEFGKCRVLPKRIPEGRIISPHIAVREGDWKLLVNADGSGTELYNIVEDVNETTNLVAEYPEIAERLSAAAREWFNEANRQYVGPFKKR